MPKRLKHLLVLANVLDITPTEKGDLYGLKVIV